jgi:hypothetical protein
MSTYPMRHQPGDGGLHPRLYMIMVGLTVWMVLSIWFLFDRGGYIGLTLAMITLFFVILLGIPSLIWLASRKGKAPTPSEDFHDWGEQGFDTWTERLSGKAAAIQILLPLAAVAFGMTIFGSGSV